VHQQRDASSDVSAAEILNEAQRSRRFKDPRDQSVNMTLRGRFRNVSLYRELDSAEADSAIPYDVERQNRLQEGGQPLERPLDNLCLGPFR
jgi:hypothetical protein